MLSQARGPNATATTRADGPVVSYGKTSKGTNYTQDNEAIRRAASEEPRVKSRREALLEQDRRYQELQSPLEDPEIVEECVIEPHSGCMMVRP